VSIPNSNRLNINFINLCMDDFKLQLTRGDAGIEASTYPQTKIR
jgi:hypothetical protein